MVWLANLAVSRNLRPSLVAAYAAVGICLVLSWFGGAGMLNQFSLPVRGLLGGTLFAIPIGFAGLIFSTLFERAARPSISLGSNLLGAVLGGMLEYSSMALGLRAMSLVALALYGMSALAVWRRR